VVVLLVLLVLLLLPLVLLVVVLVVVLLALFWREMLPCFIVLPSKFVVQIPNIRGKGNSLLQEDYWVVAVAVAVVAVVVAAAAVVVVRAFDIFERQ
jgi:hypothetical protein